MIKGEYEKESKHDCRELVSECKREREKRREGGDGRERSRPTYQRTPTAVHYPLENALAELHAWIDSEVNIKLCMN